MSRNQTFLDNLIGEKIIGEKALEKLVEKYKQNPFYILLHLYREGREDKDLLGRLWGNSINVAYVNLETILFQQQAVSKIPEKFAYANSVIPLYQLGKKLTVATDKPTDPKLVREIEKIVGLPVSPVFAFPDDVKDAIDIQYQTHFSLKKIIARVTEISILKDEKNITKDHLKLLSRNQVTGELARGLLLIAVKERASDIHIEQHGDHLNIRFRIDGILQEKYVLDSKMIHPLSARLKYLAKLDAAENQKPQKGRFNIFLSNRTIDFTLNSFPMINGEKVSLKILSQIRSQKIPELDELDFSGTHLRGIKEFVTKPMGSFLITGGDNLRKKKTVYSILQYLNEPVRNIVTIEDLVEFRLPGINQARVDQKMESAYYHALQFILEQDPDVIMIEEIMDSDTAKTALRSALSGCLILSIMHTPNAPEVISRLVEIGVEPFIVASALNGILAQRTVRRICPYCRESYELTDDEIDRYFIRKNNQKVVFYRGKGCSECNQTGYTGTLGIYELFFMTEEIRALTARGATIFELNRVARKSGFKNMRYDCMKKVLRGLTTIDELERVTMADEIHE